MVSNVKDLHPFGNSDINELCAAEKYKEAEKALLMGDTVSANKLFILAKDLDPVRFRASEEINQIIYAQAEKHNATLVPTKKYFQNNSKFGIIGNSLLTEHVHPNIDGQFVLADAFYSSIVKSKQIAQNTSSAKDKKYYRTNWGYTELDSLIGEYKIKQLKSYWPFSSLNVEVTFRDTFKTSGIVDSLAFSVLTNPSTNIASLHNFLGEFYE